MLCWVFGAQFVSHTPVASTSAASLVVDKVSALRAGIEDPAIFAKEIGHDRFRDTPARPAADRPARQGRHPRVRRGLRQGRGPGLLCLATGRCCSRQRDQAAAGRRLLLSERLPHLADVRRHQLAGALHPALGPLGQQPTALRPAPQDQPLHTQRRVQPGRVADRRCRAIERPDLARGVVVLPLRQGL